MTPDAVVLLANLGRPRRPAGARDQLAEPILPEARTATSPLRSLPIGAIKDEDLPALRRVQEATRRVVEALLHNVKPDCAELNAIASASHARLELTVDNGRLCRQLSWTDPTPAAHLARRVIDELADLDPDRIRRCSAPSCDLIFYDTTRSRTRRWHAEDPCGWRERQQHHRGRPSTQAPPKI